MELRTCIFQIGVGNFCSFIQALQLGKLLSLKILLFGGRSVLHRQNRIVYSNLGPFQMQWLHPAHFNFNLRKGLNTVLLDHRTALQLFL
jgi:hypothetical protein